MTESKSPKCHPGSEQPAQALAVLTTSPTIVYFDGTHRVPEQLQRMPGVSQFYLSNHGVMRASSSWT